MAVKASAHITLNSVVDIAAYYRYYLLQSSTLSAPSVPTTNPPGGSWGDAEPTYTSGSTNSLYFVDCTVFSDGGYSYSDVSLSSSYEASKEAYNKALNTENNLATNYYTKTQTDAQINVTKESIMSTVSATYATKTDVDADIDEVRSSLTNYAEISILDDKIQNVVSSNYVSQSEFGTFKGEYESQLTQTNNAISGKVSSSEFSTLKSNVDDQAKRLTDVETYFELTEDGFYVGGTKFQYVAKLTGDQLQFGLRSDDTFTPISWFATNTMYNTNVDVAEALSIGKSNSDTDGSYEFHQEADGTFSLIYKE